MLRNWVKCLLVAAFSLIFSSFFNTSFAQQNADSTSPKKKKSFNAQEIIFGHVLDGHDFHFFDITKKDGTKHPIGIPLPVILYSPQRGLSFFMSSKFHHGEELHDNYRLVNAEYLHEEEKKGMDIKKSGLGVGKIIPVDTNGEWDKSVSVYDISITRNVVQMILSLVLLVWIMLSIARQYKKGEGVKTAPKGLQNLMEPVITFVRDEVAKPNLGNKWEKYLPFLLTIFFFILINNLFGLIPGSANVTGNIAFTFVLGIISFIVILASSKKHYWGHIFNPPGMPFWVKIILVPVEFVSVFVKPMALIIRLFANMVAGHIIIICLVSLIFIFSEMNKYVGIGSAPLAIGFTIFIYFIEILVAFLQAFIFAMLSAVFIGQAFEGEHHEEAAAH